MKIYVSHSRNFDYINELYKPLKEAGLQVEFTFPHDEGEQSFSSKELFEAHGVELVLAEVSYPSTGQGIELGWADIYGVNIMCFYKTGSSPAKSLGILTNKIIEYTDSMDLVNKFTTELQLHIA